MSIGSLKSTDRFPVSVVNKMMDGAIAVRGTHGNGAPFNTAIPAANTNIGSITKSFNYAYALKYIAVTATSHDLDIRAQIAYNPSIATVYSDTRYYVARGTTLFIPCNGAEIVNSGDARINVMGVYDPVTKAALALPVTVTGTVSFHSDIELAEKDTTCDSLFMFIGDSITVAETGIPVIADAGTMKNSTWTWQLRYKMRRAGHRVRMVMKGISGTNTAQHVVFMKNGDYDLPGYKIINILLGTNNASQAVTVENFIADITEMVTYFRAMYPDAVIVLCGATPTDNTTWHNLLVTYRAALSAYVTALADPITKYIDLGDSFTRTDLTNYATTDTAGSKIHLSVQGNLAVSTNWWTKFSAFNLL